MFPSPPNFQVVREAGNLFAVGFSQQVFPGIKQAFPGMQQRSYNILMFVTTPIIFLFGSLLMYLLISDHPWFWQMIGSYFVLLVILSAMKLILFRKFASVQKKTQQKEGYNSIQVGFDEQKKGQDQ